MHKFKLKLRWRGRG